MRSWAPTSPSTPPSPPKQPAGSCAASTPTPWACTPTRTATRPNGWWKPAGPWAAPLAPARPHLPPGVPAPQLRADCPTPGVETNPVRAGLPRPVPAPVLRRDPDRDHRSGRTLARLAPVGAPLRLRRPLLHQEPQVHPHLRLQAATTHRVPPRPARRPRTRRRPVPEQTTTLVVNFLQFVGAG